MKEEHTKGPWYNNGGQIEHIDPETSYTQVIGAVGVVNDQSMTDTANARLIAAAPDLLEACQSIAALANGQGRLNLVMVAGQAKRAISEATKE